MSVFEGRYFNFNRKLRISVGLWPYETRTKYIARIFYISILFLLSIPQLLTIILHYEDTDKLMLSALVFLSFWVMNLKMFAMIMAEENMKNLHRSISHNWQVIQDSNERGILEKYSERGRKVSIFYLVYMVASGVSMMMLPLVTVILDVISPLENPRPKFYIMEGEYYIDRQGHFTLFLINDVIATLAVALVSITIDTMYIISAEHCCALYAIVRYRLQKLRRKVDDNSLTSKNDNSYEWLVHTIKLHQSALTFTSALDDSFSKCFLFILTVTLVIVPCDACAILANLNNPLHVSIYVIYFVVIMFHLFVLFWPGQRILDHALDLCDAAYDNEWYTTPLRTRKLLLIFMQRCSQPVSITAGGLFVMDFEIYSKIMRTSTSYITVASSFR